MWRAWVWLALTACGGELHPPAADAPVDPDAPTEAPLVFQLCVGGSPGDALCPFNVIPLDRFGSVGSELRFVVQVVGSTSYVTSLHFAAGPDGLIARNPRFVEKLGDGQRQVIHLPSAAIDLHPFETTMPSAMVLASLGGGVTFTFDGAQR